MAARDHEPSRSCRKRPKMGLEYFLRAINANSDQEMIQVLDEFDRKIEVTRAMIRATVDEPSLDARYA